MSAPKPSRNLCKTLTKLRGLSEFFYDLIRRCEGYLSGEFPRRLGWRRRLQPAWTCRLPRRNHQPAHLASFLQMLHSSILPYCMAYSRAIELSLTPHTTPNQHISAVPAAFASSPACTGRNLTSLFSRHFGDLSLLLASGAYHSLQTSWFLQRYQLCIQHPKHLVPMAGEQRASFLAASHTSVICTHGTFPFGPSPE